MIQQRIAEVLNEHDIDDYCDDLDDGGIEQGIHCLKCGWKGVYQREANAHLSEVLVAELGLTQMFRRENVVPTTRDDLFVCWATAWERVQ